MMAENKTSKEMGTYNICNVIMLVFIKTYLVLVRENIRDDNECRGKSIGI